MIRPSSHRLTQDQQIKTQQILEKYQRKKFESLSLEELAFAVSTPVFPQIFKKVTGEDWIAKYQIKARERLSHAKYDTQWNTRKSGGDFTKPLFGNTEKGDLNKIKDFMKLCGPNSRKEVLKCTDISQKTPLHIACQKGHLEIVYFFINEGFNVNALDRTQKSPLHYACIYGDSVEMVKILIQNGGKISQPESTGKNCLHMAVGSDNPELVRFLIQQNQDLVNSVDNSYLTPLHYSTWNVTPKQLEIMRILIEKGADPNCRDIDGATPLFHAAKDGRVKAVKILLSNGSNALIKDNKHKKTAIEIALNEQTREALVVYGNKQFKHQNLLTTQEQNFLEQTKLIEKVTVQVKEGEEIEVQDAPNQINPFKDCQGAPVSQFFRGKFYTLMKKLQEEGVKKWEHVINPDLFTSSWMEGIQGLEDLYKMYEDVSAHETLLRVFNLLCPYESQLPIPEKKNRFELEEQYYGKKWYEMNASMYKRKQLQFDRDLEDFKEKIKNLEDANEVLQDEKQLLEIKIDDLSVELSEKQKRLEYYELQIKQSKKQYEDIIQKLKNDQAIKDKKIKDLEADIVLLKDNLENQMNSQLDNLQGQLNKKTQEYEEECEDHQKTKDDSQEKLRSKQDEIDRLEREKKALEEERKRKMEVNLDPEGALVKMFINIEQQKPFDITERMRQCDIDKNKQLTSLEFMLYCERLQLNPLETKVLQKLAGILPEKQEREAVPIEEWKELAENHQVIKRIWNLRLFSKILTQIQKRKIDFKLVCDKLDVNNSEKIEPKELQKGLFSLKIYLNQKDQISIFTNIDTDGNGYITTSEFENELTKYQQELNKDPFEPKLTFQHRFLPDHYDYNTPQIQPLQEQNPLDGLILDNFEKRVKLTSDVIPVNGNLMVQIPYGKNLLDQQNLKSVTIRCLLKGSGSDEKSLINSLILYDDSQWNYNLIIQVRNVLKENVNDCLHIMLFTQDDDFITDKNFLGEVKILWKQCIDNPEKWHITQEFKLGNMSFLKEKSKEVSGHLAVQCKWIPSTSENFIGEIEEVDLLQIQPTRKQFTRSIVEPGILEVTIVSGYLQELQKKVKCKVKLPKKSDESFKAKYDAKKQPYWGEKIFVDLSESTNKPLDSIFLQIYVDNGMFSSNDILGEVYIDWEECLDWVGDYLTRKAYLYKAHPQQKDASKVYVKVRWIPKSIYQKLTGYSEGSEKDKKKQIKASKEDLQFGVLKVIAMNARDMRADDGATSDPYAIFKFLNYDEKQLKYQTKTKGKTLNPKWNEQFTFNLQFFKDGPVPPLQVKFMDDDLAGDDYLGQLDIDLHDVIDKPCEWFYDEDYFEIEDPKFNPQKQKKPAEFQLCVYWVPEGTQDPNIKPKNWRDDKTVKGTVKINIIHAREVKIADSKSSDPYAIVKFPNGKEKETSVISNSLNPIWNESFSQEVLISQERMDSEPVPIKITLKDSDTLAKDDVLGYCDIKWNTCIQNPGDWAINDIFELQGAPDIKKNLKTLGYIYIQVKFLEEGMQDDDSKPKCIENLAEIISQQQGLYKGTLRVFLVHAKGVVKADSGDKDFSDPFVVFKVPGGKKVQSKEIKDTLNPEWKTIYKVPVSMPMNTIQPMRVEILDSDIIGNDLIGYLTVDLLKCLKTPNKWAYNEITPILGDTEMLKKYKPKDNKFGEIYMQIMFNPEGINNEDPPLPLEEDLSNQLRKEMEEAKKPMNGLLRVNVVFARGLKIADKNSSDPYCEIHFPDKKSISTKHIDSDLNPIWNFQYRYTIKFNKESYKPIKFIVKDKDTMAVDDTLGQTEIEWMECFDNPTMWQVNNMFKLQGTSKTGEDLGDIYIQMQYIPEKDIENPEAQTICKTNPDVMDHYGRILGVLELKIISGLDLKNEDWGGKSDPFIEAYMSSKPKEKLKTQVINDNLNPIWDFEGKFFIDILRCQVKDQIIYFDLFDDDNLSSTQMGQVGIDLIDCLEKQGQYIEDEYTVNDHKKKDSNTNFGTVKLAYKWLPDKDCETIEGLRVPEKIFKGVIFVKIVNCKQFPKKIQSFVHFSLSNNVKTVYKTAKRKNEETDPEYNHTEEIQIEIGEKKYKTLKSHFIVIDDGFIDSNMGGFTINLREIMDNPGKWINSYEKIRSKNEEKKPQGYCYIQIQFRPEKDSHNYKEIDTKDPEPVDFEKLMAAEKPVTYPGNLKVNIVGARKIPTSCMDKSDPFVKVTCNKGQKKVLQTKTIDDNLSPFWDFSDQIPLDLQKEDQQNVFLKCLLYDYDFASNDLLGSLEVDVNELFIKPGEWINQVYPLLDTKNFPGAGELYLQIQWVPDNQEGIKIQDLPENLFQKEQEEQQKKDDEKKKKEEEENKIPDQEGILFINVIRAYNIVKSDTFSESDGIVVLKVNKGSKQILKTQEIENNKNPEFNKQLEFQIKAKPQDLQSNFRLSATLEDVDTEGNDFLGYLELPLDDYIKDPKLWYNEITQLCDSKGTPGKNGLLYLQVQWRPNDVKDLDTKLPKLKSRDDFYKGVDPVGFVLIKVVQAKSILGVEKKGESSDAKLKVLFNKNSEKTKVQKSLNPVWNQIFQFQIKFNDRSEFPFMKCELWDDNFTSDDFLGDFEANIGEVLEKPDEWAIKKSYTFANLQKRKTKGDIDGTCEIWCGFVQSKDKIKVLSDKQN